jgi:hypothetical protein
MNKIKVGSGWKIVDKLRLSEVLLVRAFDARSKKFSWAGVDGRDRGLTPLATLHEPLGTPPIFAASRSELIYVSTQGITVHPLASKGSRVISPLDWTKHSVARLWLSGDSRSLHYLQSTMSPNIGREAIRTTRSTDVIEKTSLYSCATDGTALHKTLDFDEKLAFDTLVGPGRDLLVSLTNKEIRRVDIAGARTVLVRKERSITGLAGSTRGSFLTWSPFGDGVLDETLPNGRRKVLLKFGRYPAFSTDDSRIAFTSKDNELWLWSDGDAQFIASLPGTRRDVVDTPTWCPCGEHFAVSMTLDDAAREKQNMIIADARARKLLLVTGSAASSARIWLPC